MGFSSVQFSSVAQLCPTLCDPMNRSTPGLPVHHQLPEFTQTHIHRVSDAIQPSHPVIPFSSCPQSLPASDSFPMSQLFTWGGQSTGVSALASFLPRKSQGWSPSECTGWISLQSKGLSRVFSNTFRTTKDWSGHVCFESQYWIQCLAQNVIEKLFAWISLCPEKVSGNRHQRLLFWITFHSVTV